jgi:DNA-directed RNA polymerase specialized sigma subunit
MSWIERKVRTQNRNKRPKLQFTLDKIVLESENGMNNDKLYIDNILSHYSETPEENDKYENLMEFINEFIKRNKGGYIIQEMLLNGKGYTEVAKERGTSPQCECQKYIRYLNKLKKELKENGYIDKNID